MKSIVSDPVAWSRSFVGSKWRIGIWISFHLLFFIILIFWMYDAGAQLFLPLIFLVGVWFPLLYLYALRRLLILLENKKENEHIKN